MASGKIQFESFDTQSGDIESYLERMEMHFIANDVAESEENAAKRKAILLSSIGSDAYRILKDICFPTAPTAKSYTELTNELKKHFKPKRLAVAERFRFNTVQQQPGQTVSEFVAQLKKLSTYCEYTGDQLKESLRDRFICGLRSEGIQKKLLAKTYTFERAVEIAIAEEAATKDIKEMSQHAIPQINAVKQVSQPRPRRGVYRGASKMPRQAQARQPCDRCGLKNHTRDKCWYKDKECFKCGKVGHLKSECRSVKKQTRNPQNVPSPARTHYVEQTEQPDTTELTEWDAAIFGVIEKSPEATEHKPITVPVDIEGISLILELDTGAAVSIVSYSDYLNILNTSHCLTQQDTCMYIQAHP